MLRFLGVVALLAIVLFVVGLFAGWFTLAEARAGDRTQVTIGVDRGEIQRDVDDVRRGVERRLAGSAVEGTLDAIDTRERELHVATASGAVEKVLVADAAEIVVDGREVGMTELRRGDAVELTIGDDGRATRIVARRV